MRKINIGSIYRHYKDRYYVVLDIVNDSESEGEIKKILIYKGLYDEYLIWARPIESFNDKIKPQKPPYIDQEYRFEEIKIDSEEIKVLQNKIKENSGFINSIIEEISDYMFLVKSYDQIKRIKHK